MSQGRPAQTASYYGEANQSNLIDHHSPQAKLPHLVYTYNARGLPETVTEFNHLRHELAEVTFTYDNLGRLIHEVRYDVIQGEDVYDLTYEYDPGGNRTRKIDTVNEIDVRYHYDLEYPGAYASANNRLMYYETFDTSGGGQVLESTTYCFYNSSGNVTRVVTNQEGSNEYEATLLGYARNESTVTFVLGERWDWDDDPAHDPTGYDIVYAREFRYDGARQRYLNRELDPSELRDNHLLVSLDEVWSDYDGDEIYGDFALEGPTVTVTRSFEPGVGRVDDPFGLAATREYYHGDLIGTTRDVSYKGSSTAPAVYTAFGGLVAGTNYRYGYLKGVGHASFSTIRKFFRDVLRIPISRGQLAKRFRLHGDAYFRFITTPGIEPTNNLAEQAIRFVVIDRRITQGTRSERGQRWCERIWTAVATCAQQERSMFEYLGEAVNAHFHGQPIPSLLPAGP